LNNAVAALKVDSAELREWKRTDIAFKQRFSALHRAEAANCILVLEEAGKTVDEAFRAYAEGRPAPKRTQRPKKRRK
tara:strand:- start:116 stop:346 length:231 start_codon:yes stop_codon:yes gene_type:complete